jgi:Peptidase family M28
MSRCPLPLTLVLAVGCSRSTSPITASELRHRVEIIADDSMRGRLPGSRGNVETTDYIASEFRRLGLRPAGDSGGYFQYVPMVSSRLDTTVTLTVNGAPLPLWTGVVPQNPRNAELVFDPSGSPIVYGGRLGPDPSAMISGNSVGGKILVFAVAQLPDGRPDPRSGRFLPPFYQAPSAVVFVLPQMPVVSLYTRLKRFSVLAAPRPGSVIVAPLTLQIGASTAQALFGGPVEGLAVGAVAPRRFGGGIRYFAPDTIQARNVVAILPGSDPVRRDEYVGIGAHNDHLGVAAFSVDHDSVRAYNILLAQHHLDGPAAGNPGSTSPLIHVNVDSLRRIRSPRRDSIFNGADDDGAGTASLLAIAQALATRSVHPARSVLFLSHTGEEQGLLGSRWYADHPTVPRDSIVTYLNMDLFGHEYNADSARSGPRYIQSGGARRLSTELGALVDSVNATLPEPMAIDYSWDVPGHPSQKYCRSDHASYARYGIPVAYFSTGYGVDYHQVTDEPQYLDYAHMARAATLVYAVALRVADLDHRPVVDKPKPDPNAPCRQ